MFNSRYSKLLTGLLIGGIVLIVLLLVFFGFKLIRNYYINKDARDAVERFQGEVTDTQGSENTVQTNTEGNYIFELQNIVVSDGESNGNANERMYKGYPMAGTIEIPTINLKSPILKSVSKKAIEVAIAMDEGSAGLNQIGNTILVGHNYRNGTFFSNNKNLKQGDKIYITDEKGKKLSYTIYNIYVTGREDDEVYTRETKGKREITLTTCTDDVKNILVIWAKEG